MSWKRIILLILILGLLWLWQQWPDGRLKVVFCDVGQGDAALVVLGSFQALVDTGPNEQLLFSCLGEEMPFWDRQIDLVFISHPQADHNGALKGLLSRYKVTRVVEKVMVNDLYRYNDLYFDILNGAINGTENSNSENEDSTVLLLRYFDFSVLFTADIGEMTELALLDKGVLRKTSVLKVPHHGSKFSSSSTFLEKLKPVVAVVSVGAKNKYGHPNGDTLMRLEQVRAKIFRTDLSGSVRITYDSGKLKVFTQK